MTPARIFLLGALVILMIGVFAALLVVLANARPDLAKRDPFEDESP